MNTIARPSYAPATHMHYGRLRVVHSSLAAIYNASVFTTFATPIEKSRC